MSKVFLASLILFCQSFAHAGDAVPFAKFSPFKADYVGKYSGVPMKAKGVRELTMRGDDDYVFRTSASSMMIKVEETSEFRLTPAGIQPISYRYKRGKKKDDFVSFDWDKRESRYAEINTPLEEGTLDKLGYQMQLRLAVARQRAAGETGEIRMTVADKAKRKDYRFKIVGEESLKTAAGEFETVRVKRLRDNPDRYTEFWLATEHEYLLVKLVQQDESSGFELNLKSVAWK